MGRASVIVPSGCAGIAPILRTRNGRSPGFGLNPTTGDPLFSLLHWLAHTGEHGYPYCSSIVLAHAFRA
jgi:hypothetical protein